MQNIMHLLKHMNTEKRYTAVASYGSLKTNSNIRSILVIWLVLAVWAFVESLYSLLLAPAIITLVMFLPHSLRSNAKFSIIINDGVLSIHSGEAILWSTVLLKV